MYTVFEKNGFCSFAYELKRRLTLVARAASGGIPSSGPVVYWLGFKVFTLADRVQFPAGLLLLLGVLRNFPDLCGISVTVAHYLAKVVARVRLPYTARGGCPYSGVALTCLTNEHGRIALDSARA